MTDKTYEQIVTENWPRERLPLDEGKHCPPFRATLFRLADAMAKDEPLTSEQQRLMEHIDVCGACRSTVSSVAAHLASNTADKPNDVLNDVAWEGTPIRRLRDCAKELRLFGKRTVSEVFAALRNGAGLTEVEALNAVGLSKDKTDELEGESGVWLLTELGVEEGVLTNIKLAEGTMQFDAMSVGRIIAAKAVGPPRECSDR